MAKLYDLAAIFGPTNSETIKKMITTVFENDNRYIADFKDSIDAMVGQLKKTFNASLKVTEMTRGDDVFERP